ncbi:MAG TPA: FAD-dependent oxidoreductase, partial [Chloroflexota bacterium]
MLRRTDDTQLAPAISLIHVAINSERCAGCQECVIRCPTEALHMVSGSWVAEADDSRCVGCRQCQRVCPYACITVHGPLAVDERAPERVLRPQPLRGDTSELRRGFQNLGEAIAEANRCLSCPDPTCMEGCPAHNDIPGFIAALRSGDLEQAHSTLRRTSVLPDICSRVCDQAAQCEGACSWALAGGEPVAIGRLERFITEQKRVPGVTRQSEAGAGLSVAIAGSGPAGVAAAWELLEAGASVTMFEKENEPGGVLRWGIPSFILPDPVAQRPMAALLNAGLDLRTGCAVGVDVSLASLLERYDALILAHGAVQPLIPPVEGRNLPGVTNATEFLGRGKRALQAGTRLPEIAQDARVLVVGGGNTAMDVARTVLRLGGKAVAVEWMDRRFAKVRPDELEEALSEGVEIRFNTTVERLEGGEAGVHTAWLLPTRQDRVDRKPTVLNRPAEPFFVDLVVFALGYRVDASLAGLGVQLPLPRADDKDAVLDRRWLASGIMNGVKPAGASNAVAREWGLATAGSPV